MLNGAAKSSYERYIEKQNRIIEQDKEETLIALGIVEIEYSPNGEKSEVYDKFVLVDGKKVFCKIKAANVSDEEYALILEKRRQVAEIQKNNAKNKAAMEKDDQTGGTWVAAFIRLVCTILIVVAAYAIHSLFAEENQVLGWILIGVSIVGILLLYAIAEMLDRLNEIAYNTRKIANK